MSLRFNIQAFDKTKAAFASVNRNVNGLKSRFQGLKNSFGGLGAGIVAALSGAAIKAILDITDKVQKFALITQISTENLSQLKFAGEQSGVEFDKLQVAIRKTGKSVSDATRGLKTQADALADLGLNANELIKLPLDKQFEIVGDRLRGVTNQSDKLRIAMDIMGRSGSELLAMFDNNAESIGELRQQLRDLGGEITQEQADSLAGLNDAWNRFATVMEGIGRVLITAVAPAFETLLDTITFVFSSLLKGVRTVLLLDDALAGLMATTGNFLGLIDDETEARVLDNLNEKWQGIWGETDRATDSLTDYKAALGGVVDEKALAKAAKNAADFQNALDELQRDTARDSFSIGMSELEKKLFNVDVLVKQLARRYDTELTPAQQRQIENIKDWVIEIDEAQEAQRKLESFNRELGDSFSAAFEEGVMGAKSFGDVLGSLADQIQNLLFKRFVTAPLNDFIGGIDFGFGSGDSSGGGLLSGIGDFFGGFFANGGDFDGTKPIVVGEKGAELMIPRAPGTVIPNDKMGSFISQMNPAAANAQPIIINQSINVSTGVQQTVAAEMQRFMPQIKQASVEAVRNAQNRGALS